MIDLQYRSHSQWQVDRFAERHGAPIRFHVVFTSAVSGSETLFGLAATYANLEVEIDAYNRDRNCGDLPSFEVVR